MAKRMTKKMPIKAKKSTNKKTIARAAKPSLHQKDLAKMGSEIIGRNAGLKALRAGKTLDISGIIYGKAEKKAYKRTMKSFK